MQYLGRVFHTSAIHAIENETDKDHTKITREQSANLINRCLILLQMPRDLILIVHVFLVKIIKSSVLFIQS